jgi:hypothetical protein
MQASFLCMDNMLVYTQIWYGVKRKPKCQFPKTAITLKCTAQEFSLHTLFVSCPIYRETVGYDSCQDWFSTASVAGQHRLQISRRGQLNLCESLRISSLEQMLTTNQRQVCCRPTFASNSINVDGKRVESSHPECGVWFGASLPTQLACRY